MTNEKNALGLRIKELREAKGLSQTQLAKDSKIARTVITMIENGQRYPSEKTLNKIIDILGVTSKDVYTEDVTEQAKKQLLEYSPKFLEKASADEIIKVYRKMIKDE